MASTLAGVARPDSGQPAVPHHVGARTASERRDRILAVFAFPSLIWYVIFTIGPLVAMFVIAFLSWGRIFETPEFAGWANFDKLIHDERVLTAAGNTAVHLVGTLPFQTVGSFMIGYFLSLKPPGHRFFRVVLFIPALISLAQLGTIFTLVGGPAGLVNSLLDKIGLGEYQTAWFADSRTAMISLIVVSIWTGMGFNSILFAARLGSIDQEVYAAAELDGANHWQRIWRVAFPISIDYFGVVTMLQYLWTLFGTAGLILILTKGGPGQATSTLSWLVYRFAFYDTASLVGYSQAIGILLFVLGVVGLVIIRRVFRQRY
jgi:multiple sugar transport system permease protein